MHLRFGLSLRSGRRLSKADLPEIYRGLGVDHRQGIPELHMPSDGPLGYESHGTGGPDSDIDDPGQRDLCSRTSGVEEIGQGSINPSGGIRSGPQAGPGPVKPSGADGPPRRKVRFGLYFPRQRDHGGCQSVPRGL